MTSSILMAAFLSAFGFTTTCILIPLLKKAALKNGLVAAPGGRRNHAKATPLLGGLAIYPPFAVVFLSFFALLWSGYLSLQHPTMLKMLSLFAGTTWLLILGTLDDRKDLGWRKKLLGQILGGVILVAGGHNIFSATLPLLGPIEFGWYGIPLLVVLVVVITNAINLIDGMDGLAGGICFFAALTSSVIGLVKGDIFTATIGFTISGSLLGFLMFNFPPASIFLGDGGSMMLGFLLGTLATSHAAAVSPGQRFGTSMMILIPFLPFGIPLFEVALSISRRWIRGQAIFLADGDHLHHRLIDKMKNPRLTVAVFYFFSAALCGLTLFLVFEESSMAFRFLAAAIATVVFAGAIASIRLYRVNQLLTTLRNRRHFKFLGTFLPFMRNRLSRARSFHELVELLQTGVKDLGFDYVEVTHGDHLLERWTNIRPPHPENPRIHAEETFQEYVISIRWARALHDDETYNEYLMLTWHRFLMAFRSEMKSHQLELAGSKKNNVVELTRKIHAD
ncbi:MAG: undecaprenyl/decaprenyl-phosphate alpha-N-acetylglucosaminyl 1-phosphate transferase [Desulfomonile tiedjei]|nr:undecaprenyl/decaprenyl-phosphate alpha-N-acetylglucosaminyl 1-phosphate transferase [Desulfomonile tiedjei]